MYIKTDANGLVIGVTDDIEDSPIPSLIFDKADEGCFFNHNGTPLFKVEDGRFMKRSVQEIDEAEDVRDESPSEPESTTIEDRIAALEQEIELLLSGEVE